MLREWALGLGLLLLVGCASHAIPKASVPVGPSRPVDVDTVRSAWDGYCRGLETLNGSGDLDVKDFKAGKERKLGVRLLAGRGGKLYVKGSVLLVTGLEVVSNGERFWFQVPSRKTIWTGRADAVATAEGSQNEPYYALRPRDVSEALLPEAFSAASGEPLFLESDAGRACLSATAGASERGTLRRRVCLDRETLQPQSLTLYDEHGELTTQVGFADVRDGSAFRVSIARPREGYLAAFAFDKLVRNAPVPEKAFVPRSAPDYKVVEVTP